MKDRKRSRLVISDPRMAAVFTHPVRRRILLWFTGRPKSAGEAAAALRLDLRRLHDQLGRMRALGLLCEVGRVERPGRPIRLYRAVADSFFISHEAALKGFGDDLAAELRDSLSDRLGTGGGGILFTATPGGSPRGRLVRDRDTVGDAFEAWRILRLAPQDLTELQKELNAVLNRFQRRTVKSGQVFLVHAAAAPRKTGLRSVDNPA